MGLVFKINQTKYMLQLQIIGNLGSDATIKETNGSKFASFSLAVNENYKNKEGQKVEKTTWVNCVLNDPNHGAIPFIKKGNKIFVQGKLSVRKYKLESSSESQIQITCNVANLELLGSTNNNTNSNDGMPQ